VWECVEGQTDRRTDTQTDASDQYTFRVVYDSATHAKCNNFIRKLLSGHTHTHTHDRVLYLDNYSGQQKMLQYIPVSPVRGIERRRIIARQSFDPARLCGRTRAGWVRSDTVITGGCHDAA